MDQGATQEDHEGKGSTSGYFWKEELLTNGGEDERRRVKNDYQFCALSLRERDTLSLEGQVWGSVDSEFFTGHEMPG